jgi:hypothetical protein
MQIITLQAPAAAWRRDSGGPCNYAPAEEAITCFKRFSSHSCVPHQTLVLTPAGTRCGVTWRSWKTPQPRPGRKSQQRVQALLISPIRASMLFCCNPCRHPLWRDLEILEDPAATPRQKKPNTTVQRHPLLISTICFSLNMRHSFLPHRCRHPLWRLEILEDPAATPRQKKPHTVVQIHPLLISLM